MAVMMLPYVMVAVLTYAFKSLSSLIYSNLMSRPVIANLSRSVELPFLAYFIASAFTKNGGHRFSDC